MVIDVIWKFFYSRLMASIGFLLAADFAGSTPKASPIKVATKKDKIMEFNESMVSIPVASSNPYDATIPNIIPIIPPPKLIRTDSDRN